jgi:hypothetical protein
MEKYLFPCLNREIIDNWFEFDWTVFSFYNCIFNYFNFFEIKSSIENRYAIIVKSFANSTGLGLPIGNKCTTQDRMKKDRIKKIENNKIEYDIW